MVSITLTIFIIRGLCSDDILDDGQSYLDDPPDTPAPVFVVRAFKSALFGTPHIEPEIGPTTPPPMAPAHRARKKDYAAPVGPRSPNNIGQKIDEDGLAKQKAYSLVSPTKGILLTPGTGTTRRKNVTFGGLALSDEASAEDSRRTDAVLGLDVKKPSTAKPLPIDQHRQTNLTGVLHKAKIGPSKENIDPGTGDDAKEDHFLPFEPVDGYRAKADGQDEAADLNADTTLDLNQPFSRSGKHWKAEYERYHKKSDREMKQIIKYGKSVKSFAVKKDSEASELGEKLQLELSKVAAMEAKVSRLAIQLASARLKGSEDAEQTKLVNDLAKQTALAVRYKQKADRYRSALLKKTSMVAQPESKVETALPQSAKSFAVGSFQVSDYAPEMASLRSELGRFRESAKLAEEKIKLLEAENVGLRESMSRLKAEAASYETNRLAREEDFKKRTAIMTSAREDCEARLNQVTADYQKLLRELRCQGDSQGIVGYQTMDFSKSGKQSKPLDLGDAGVAPKTTVPKVISQHSKPSQRINLQQSHVNIWTLSPRGDGMNEISSVKTPAFDQVSEHMESDIFGALREINQNLISERGSGDPLPSFNRASIPRTTSKLHKRRHESEILPENTPKTGSVPEIGSEKAPLPGPQPIKSSASKRMRERRSTITSPRPSLLNFPPGPSKIISDPVPSDQNPQLTLVKASLPSSSSAPFLPVSSVPAAASRTNPLAGGRKQTTLPPERAAAAKARLMEKSIEKRMARGRKESRASR